jgi:glycerol-3-phosphate acyltransferase PlsY
VTPAVAFALMLLAAYVCGSVPSAYLAGRLLKGVDLRTVGSGNLGSTNVYRELGVWPALVVLLADGAKGGIPAATFPGLFGTPMIDPGWSALACGAAAILGHTKPVFLLWKGGGKGVATAAGVFVAVAPASALAAIAVFVGTVAATRMVSLGSIVGALALPVAEVVLHGRTPAFLVAMAIAVLVIALHRDNIGRMLAGTERKIGRPGRLAR